MNTELIIVGVSAVFSTGGVLVYVGKSLQTLNQINASQKILFERTEKHTGEIARIDKELTAVKTRQEDCDSCP